MIDHSRPLSNEHRIQHTSFIITPFGSRSI